MTAGAERLQGRRRGASWARARSNESSEPLRSADELIALLEQERDAQEDGSLNSSERIGDRRILSADCLVLCGDACICGPYQSICLYALVSYDRAASA